MDLNTNSNSFYTSSNGELASQQKVTSIFIADQKKVFNVSEELEKSFVDPNLDETEPETILSINESPVASLQNLSVIIGAAKAGKTYLCLLLLARINGVRIEGISIQEGIKAAYFDTEQARTHIRRMINRLKHIGGNVNNTSFFSLRAYHPKERMQIITEFIKNNTDTKLIIVDGVRDLVFDINRPDEAVVVVSDLMKLTELYNVHIMLVLHQNKGDKNARGHLGTECVNKAETTISLRHEKDNDLRICEPQFTRNKPFDPLAFSINEKGIPVIESYNELLDSEKTRKNKITPHQIDAATHQDVIENIFEKLKKPKRSEMLSQIKLEHEKYGVFFGDNKARDFLNYYKSEGFIIANGIRPNTYYTMKNGKNSNEMKVNNNSLF